MNFKRYYYDIINNAKNRPKPNEYTEVHHIIPRSLGGLDNPNNLVILTAKEHYIAHHLLYKMYKCENDYNAETKMAYAWYAMTVFTENGKRYQQTAKQFENAKNVILGYNKGLNHSSSDKTVYSFTNRTGEVFIGTRHCLSNKLEIEVGRMADVINKKSICKDWILTENVTEDFLWKTYKITNGIETIIGYKHEITKLTPLSPTHLTVLETNQGSSYYGYWLLEINGIEFKPKMSSAHISTIMKYRYFKMQNPHHTIVGNIDYILKTIHVPIKTTYDLINGIPYKDYTIEEVFGDITPSIKRHKQIPIINGNFGHLYRYKMFIITNGITTIENTGEYIVRNTRLIFNDLHVLVTQENATRFDYWIVSFDNQPFVCTKKSRIKEKLIHQYYTVYKLINNGVEITGSGLEIEKLGITFGVMNDFKSNKFEFYSNYKLLSINGIPFTYTKIEIPEIQKKKKILKIEINEQHKANKDFVSVITKGVSKLKDPTIDENNFNGIHTWFNPKYGEETLSAKELVEKYKDKTPITTMSLRALINKECRLTFGWYLTKINGIPYTYTNSNTKTSKRANSRNKNLSMIHKWKHENGTIEELTIYQMSDKYPELSKEMLLDISVGKRSSHKNWYYIGFVREMNEDEINEYKIKQSLQLSESIKHNRTVVYKWKNNITEEIKECTVKDLCTEFKIDTQSAQKVINKTQTHCKNWVCLGKP